jgi:hypothetical protein
MADIRCGKKKRHTPHWHGPGDKQWCDGRYYEGNTMVEPPGKEV